MKRELIMRLVVVLVVVTFATNAFGVGGDMGLGTDPLIDGSEGHPFLIEDIGDFYRFSIDSDYWASGVHTRMETDISLAGPTFKMAIIAPDKSTNFGYQGLSFKGIFNGNGHVISNLKIDVGCAGNDYLGLFGFIEGDMAEIKNLGVEDVNIICWGSSWYIGGLCGRNYNGVINSCYSTGTITGNYWAGGLCGSNLGDINNSYSTGVVTGAVYIGGACGANTGNISDCNSAGTVSGVRHVGGLCGYNIKKDISLPGGTINNCSSASEVTGDEDFGGICGGNVGSINACYSTGSVTGKTDSTTFGGFCGTNNGGTISKCYSTGTVTSGNTSNHLGGFCGTNSSNIHNCYSTGFVTGGSNLGGFCGNNEFGGTIISCYSIGITYASIGSVNHGGFCGFNSNQGVISDCYFNIFAGLDNSVGIGIDELEMIDVNSFVGFDFINNSSDGQEGIWDIVSGHCPKLIWEVSDGPMVVKLADLTTLWGSGYENDPFQISNYEDFNEFITNSILNYGHYILTTDIDLSGNIFKTSVINREFCGDLNGGEHIIRNLTIDPNDNNDYLGLFAGISGSIKNLGVEDVHINGKDDSDFIGGLCGYTYGGIINNCYSTGRITGGYYIGGLCGNKHGTISNCYSTSVVTGYYNIGGLCGFNGGSIENSYSTGTITGKDWVGGLCGINSYSSISDCYSTGAAKGDRFIGGLCGANCEGVIRNCYSVGEVTGDYMYIGGLCELNRGTIINSFWDVNSSGLGRAGQDDDGAIGKTTNEMQTEVMFTDAGWDFVGDWWINEYRDYPKLGWQPFGDLNNDSRVDMRDVAVMGLAWFSGDGDVNFNSVCELSGDWVIDEADLLEVGVMWLAGPGWE